MKQKYIRKHLPVDETGDHVLDVIKTDVDVDIDVDIDVDDVDDVDVVGGRTRVAVLAVGNNKI